MAESEPARGAALRSCPKRDRPAVLAVVRSAGGRAAIAGLTAVPEQPTRMSGLFRFCPQAPGSKTRCPGTLLAAISPSGLFTKLGPPVALTVLVRASRTVSALGG